MMKRLGTWLGVLILFLLLSVTGRAEPFQDGDVVCFYGDSITHGGSFLYNIYDYYATRFPEKAIRILNAGVAGDSAGGAFGRMDEDVVSRRPTVVVFMFGMNDVGRGNYVAEPNENQLAGQRGALENYRRNMEKLVAEVDARVHPRQMIFLTPSPFDQTMVNDRNNNQPGCNDGLGRCAEIVRELAAKYPGSLVVDLHGPMTDMNAVLQKEDPKATIIGPDRVHPRAPGHLMIASLFLKAQGASPLVSNVAIDASGAAPALVTSENAELSDLKKEDGAIRFTLLEKALPFPTDPEAEPILARLPITDELNRENLAVKGLAAGNYVLTIDAKPVGKYSAEALASGVNLAANPETPQFAQAQEVRKKIEERAAAERILRNYAAVRWFLRNRGVNPDDFDAIGRFVKEKMNPRGYFEEKVPGYLESWGKRAEVIEKIDRLDAEARTLAVPKTHQYALGTE